MEIAGGAVLAFGLVAGAIALDHWNTVKAACPNLGCSRDLAGPAQHDVNVARTWATLATIGVIGGVAIAAAGLTLHLTASTGRDVAMIGLAWRL
jgi:hypothetical protein